MADDNDKNNESETLMLMMMDAVLIGYTFLHIAPDKIISAVVIIDEITTRISDAGVVLNTTP